MCCTGHFSTPNVPEFEGDSANDPTQLGCASAVATAHLATELGTAAGFDKFQGRILHAHDFRDAVEMAGRNILIIGTSYRYLDRHESREHLRMLCMQC